MRVEEGEDAVFYVADRIVEIVDEQGGIAQRYAVIVAATGNKQDFTGTQVLFFKQVTRNTDMPLLTE